jgi:hypothetical protein
MNMILRAIAFRIAFLRTRIASFIDRQLARAAARRDGHHPDEVIPVGSPTQMVGDLLTDGPEFPAWLFYSKRGQKDYGLSPLGEAAILGI